MYQFILGKPAIIQRYRRYHVVTEEKLESIREYLNVKIADGLTWHIIGSANSNERFPSELDLVCTGETHLEDLRKQLRAAVFFGDRMDMKVEASWVDDLYLPNLSKFYEMFNAGKLDGDCLKFLRPGGRYTLKNYYNEVQRHWDTGELITNLEYDVDCYEVLKGLYLTRDSVLTIRTLDKYRDYYAKGRRYNPPAVF